MAHTTNMHVIETTRRLSSSTGLRRAPGYKSSSKFKSTKPLATGNRHSETSMPTETKPIFKKMTRKMPIVAVIARISTTSSGKLFRMTCQLY